jgi:4-amino-4-deoxy-L-arabinose transferase-like glycosyltransferase
MRSRLHGLLARVPRSAVVCALVATLNATAWAILMPAFQVPDEQSHYAYAEYLVQHGRPPAARADDTLSTSESTALRALKFEQMSFAREDETIWTAAEQRRMDALLAQGGNRADGNGSANEVGTEPPLFYALQAVPYAIADGGSVLDRLQLMRLLSALLAGVTVLFVFLFVREALPAIPETWTVGALGVAFAPMFAFMSGGVNSDALLYAASAALFYTLARGFRRGLDGRQAVAIGAATGVALMAKFNAIGLLPGVAVALLTMSLRRERALRLRTLALPALALGVAIAPMLLEMLLNATLWDRPVVGATASNYDASAVHPSLGATLSYAWQFYVAPLPGVTHYFQGLSLRDLWVDGFVGSFGWLEGTFRPVVYDLALVPIAAIALLAGRTLVVQGRRVRPRLGELLSYTVLALVFMLFIAAASYIAYLRYGGGLGQIRYLFPLLPLYGVLLALAARGAGRRWTPVIGTSIVALAITHDLFSQLMVLARYYA